MFVNTGINSLIRDYRYIIIIIIIIIIVYQHQQPGGGFVVMSGRLRFTHHVITERRVNTSTDETRVEPQPSEKHSMQITGVACDHVTFAKKTVPPTQLQSHPSSSTRFHLVRQVVNPSTATNIFHFFLLKTATFVHSTNAAHRAATGTLKARKINKHIA